MCGKSFLPYLVDPNRSRFHSSLLPPFRFKGDTAWLSPKSPQLPGEPWRAAFRKRVADVKLHLGRYEVLVGQQLQLPHPAPFRQLQSDVLRVGTEPAGWWNHSVTLCSGGTSDRLWVIAQVSSGSDVPARPPAIDGGPVDHELTGATVIFMTWRADHCESNLSGHHCDEPSIKKNNKKKTDYSEVFFSRVD